MYLLLIKRNIRVSFFKKNTSLSLYSVWFQSSPGHETGRMSLSVQRRRMGGRSCISPGLRTCSCLPSSRSSLKQNSYSAWCWSHNRHRTGYLGGWRNQLPRLPVVGQWGDKSYSEPQTPVCIRTTITIWQKLYAVSTVIMCPYITY